jgi:hypothetical protein
MARHRRDSNVLPFQPPRLLTFRSADWLPATGLAAWWQWSDARFEYLQQHPDEELDGLDGLDLVYEQPPADLR